MEIIEFDIYDIQNHVTIFKKKFGILETLPPDTKMCISETNTLYVDTTNVLWQSIVRKMRQQTREKICEYLETQFAEYKLLLKMIIDSREYATDITVDGKRECDMVIEIIKTITAFNAGIIFGLRNTKQVYLEHGRMTSVIDGIIRWITIYNEENL